MKYLLDDTSWKYLWRANISNYPHIDNLLGWLKDLDYPEDVAAGIIHEFHGVEYLSGAGYLLSRSVVQKVVNRSREWRHEYLDDVALGILLEELSTPLSSLQRIAFTQPGQVQAVDEVVFKSAHSFRCNAGVNRLTDIEIMRALKVRIDNAI
jgi:hypothetical protein